MWAPETVDLNVWRREKSLPLPEFKLRNFQVIALLAIMNKLLWLLDM
jgi:hypothetical protein